MPVFLILSLLLGLIASSDALTPEECSCGFYDAATAQLYTETIVVYFNETDALPATTFATQNFVHKKEYGWTTTFRQGASPDNVIIGNQSEPSWLQYEVNPNSLELYIDGYTSEHLVMGGAIESLRQDIKYGSFRASMRSGHPYAGGSAMSMQLPYNRSSVLEIDLLNAKEPELARVTTLMNGEYAAIDLGVNYTTLEAGSSTVEAIDPWDFMEVRLDWSKDEVNFTVANNITRRIIKDRSSETSPEIPVPLVFKHWSTGDKDFMAGPPTTRGPANVAWVRAFFNSSTWTTAQHDTYDGQCSPSLACSMDDITLRGSSSYDVISTVPWSPPKTSQGVILRSAIVSAVFGVLGVIVLFNAIFRRWVPWRVMFGLSKKEKKDGNDGRATPSASEETSSTLVSSGSSSVHSHESKETADGFGASEASTACNTRPPSPTRMKEIESPMPLKSPGFPFNLHSAQSSAGNSTVCSPMASRDDLTITPLTPPAFPKSRTRPNTRPATPTNGLTAVAEGDDAADFQKSILTEKSKMNDGGAGPQVNVREVMLSRPPSSMSTTTIEPNAGPFRKRIDSSMSVWTNDSQPNLGPGHKPVPEPGHEVATTSDFHSKNERADTKGARRDPVRMVSTIPPAGPAEPTLVIAPPNQRIDYLAGVVAFSCICVTFVHFCLTFLPGVSEWGPVYHSKSDYIAEISIGPYLLSEAWIGPFFVTSSRFLSARYLRSGKLADIANKTLLRGPRMVVPIIIIAMAQYFFIELGITNALLYLPSIGWSTWPYVVPFTSFGGYVDSILNLAYVIPNAAPEIVNHYCVGVLWTIPVQLQFSYVVLLGAVMIREIKTPWKRFGFYIFASVNSWYALSWGSCFWLGLMLSDLQVTYKYTKWCHDRPWAHYSVCISMWIILALSSTVFLIANDTTYDFLTIERGWHPDWATGLPLAQTVNAGYPNYYEPRLNTVFMSVSLQVLVEMSVWIQKFLSMKMWIWIFPHIMTIYLVHGFVFWTVGSAICVAMSLIGMPYWANMLITVTVCYVSLALLCHVLTPLTDTTAKKACKNIWRWAQEEPIPKRPTLGSYSKNLILNRTGAAAEEKPVA